MNKKSKAIRKCISEREILYHYLDEPIRFECIYRCCKNVLDEGYVGKSMLFTDIKLKDIGGHYIQHLWIHIINIKDIDNIHLTNGTRLLCTGIPYKYIHLLNGKPMSYKYSFKDVEIMGVIS